MPRRASKYASEAPAGPAPAIKIWTALMSSK
jgi:hypothetical protein